MVVSRQRVGEAWIRHRKLAAWIDLPEQHVCDRRATLHPRIEREHDCRRSVRNRANDARTAFDEHQHDRLSGFCQRLDEAKLRASEGQLVDVSRRLGVRWFAETGDDDITGPRGSDGGGDVDRLVEIDAGRIRRARPEFRCDCAADGRSILWILGRAIALPRDGPPGVQRGQRVAGRSCNEHARLWRQRQHAAAVLQQDNRLARGLQRESPRFRGADSGLRLNAAHRILEQTKPAFHDQHTGDCLVDPADRNRSFVDELNQEVAEAVIRRHHAHVDPGHDRHARGLLLSGRESMGRHHPLDVFPV